MEEISSPSKKKKRMSRACWLWLHAAGMAALTILFLALPMYETKVGEERFAFGFFFEATRGMDAAPTAVYYAFFGIFLAASLLACAFAFLALRFEKDGKLDRVDRYFALGTAIFIGGHALNALVCISLSLVIPLCLSVVFAALGFASLYVHAKKFAELAEL